MIEARALTRDYGSFRAVDGVNLHVKAGDVLGFLGPNGAGKSTTMKMLTGFLRPTSGTALIDGYSILEQPTTAKQRFGYLPENGPLYQEMTVSEFLAFIAGMRALRGQKAKEAMARVIAICHLEEVLYQPIETLSKGFRQRVGMAQAVLHDPPCLILDEPTDGLDPNQKREIRRLITAMAVKKAIIISTHILEEVEAVCSRVIIIDRGKVLVDETPQALRQRHPLCNAVRLKLGDSAGDNIQTVIEGVSGVKEVRSRKDSWLIVPRGSGVEDLPERLWEAARKHKWPVVTLQPEPVTLEAVFAQLTQAQ